MSKYINNPVPSTLPIESMEVGYTKSLLKYGISTDADISGVVFWTRNVTDLGAEQKTVLPYDINARSFLIESLDIGKEYSLQGAFLDQFAESNPVLIDTKDPEILSIFNVPNYTTKTPATISNVEVLASDLGQIGSPNNSIALHTSGEATEMLVEIIPAAGLSGTNQALYNWSEATVLYRGPVEAEDVITLSAPSYPFVIRVTSKHVFSNGVVDASPVTYYGDATTPVKAADATAQPSTPSNLDITAIKVTGNVETYDMVVSWDWAALAGSGARRNALVSYRPVGTTEWKTETALSDTHTFVGVPYRKALEVQVVIKGWNENESAAATATVFISERTSDSAQAGYTVPVADTSIPVSTNIRVTDSGIKAFKDWDGTTGDVTFFLDSATGNLTVGTTDEYAGVAPFTFDADTGILSIKGQTITDEIVAADYVMGWLDGSTPTFRTANRTAATGFSETTAGIWMGYENDTTFKFSLGDGSQRITWDGSTLRISGSVVVGDTGNRTIDQAQRYIQVYRRSATLPATPTTGSFASPTPTGWSTTIPAYDGNPCYMTSRTFTSDGAYPQTNWESPSIIAEAIDVARLITLSADQQVIKFDANGNPDVTSVTITPSVQNISNPQYQWSFSGGTGTIAPGNGSVTIPYNAFDIGSQAITVTVLVPTPEGDRTDTITIIKVQDGGIGESVFSGYLTNESHTIAANFDGTVSTYAGASGQCKAFYGGTDVTASCSFSVSNGTGIIVNIDSAGNYSVANLSLDSSSATITITHPTYGSLTKVFSVAKAKTGIQGIQGDPGLDSYFHVAYSDSADGTVNFNFTSGAYIGTYVSNNSTSSTSPGAYTWVRVKGFDALIFEDDVSRSVPTNGTPITYTFNSEYAGPAILSFYGFDLEGGIVVDINGNALTPNPDDADQVTKWYNYEVELVEGSNTVSFTGNARDGGTIHRVIVALGNRGIPGVDGDNGETSYLHIAYADSADGTLNFNQSTGLYIGQYVDFNPLDSSNPADYTWARMKGTDGLGTATWTTLGGAELLEGNVIKGGSATDWASAAYSDQRFDSAVIQTKPTLTDRIMVGFADADSYITTWTDMDYAIHQTNAGVIRIYEDATLIFDVGSGYSATTTVVGVRLRDKVVEYLVNGEVVYTSTKVPSGTYRAKISFADLNDIAYDISLAPVGSSGTDANPNLIDPNKHWVIGSTGRQGIYILNGLTTENEIIQDRGPTGIAEPIWNCINGANNADGGWVTDGIPVSHKSSYRFTVWAKQLGGKDNSVYLGTSPSVINMSSGTVNTNPYFWYGDLQELDKWYLIVGIVHSTDYTGDITGLCGVYDPVTGRKIANGTEFRQNPNVGSLKHRALRYYATDPSHTVKFARPRMEKMDGSEASLASLLGVQPIIDARGKGMFELNYTGTWSTTVTNAIAAAATNVVTNGAPILDDIVTIINANNAADTPYYIRYVGGDPTLAVSWSKISMVVHGDTLIEGTVLADRVVAGIEVTAPLITGGRIEVGGSSKVILDGSNVDSPIQVIDDAGETVLGWEADTFKFRGRLGTGKIDNMSVFSQHIQNIIAPPMQNSLGGTYVAPDVIVTDTATDAITITPVFNANDKDVVASCSVTLFGLGINPSTPITTNVFIDRSLNGGAWVNVSARTILGAVSSEGGNPEYHNTYEIVYTDTPPSATEGDTLSYRFRAEYVSGAGSSYTARIFDATTAQQATGGSISGVATAATFPYVGLDLMGSSTYPRMYSANNPGVSDQWIRVPSQSGGILPYANGLGDLGSASWRFRKIYGDTLFEGTVPLANKYLGINNTAYDSLRLGGFVAADYSRFTATKTAVVGPGWITVAESSTGRGFGEVYVTDADSADHSFIRISAVRSYGRESFTVINVGSHGVNRITGVRWLSNTTDNTYGLKKLQVYVTVASNYAVRVKDTSAIPNFINNLDSVTPVLEDVPAGFAISSSGEVTGISNIYGAMALTGDIYTTSGKVFHPGNMGHGSGLDADTLDGINSSGFVKLGTTAQTSNYVYLTRNHTAPPLYINQLGTGPIASFFKGVAGGTSSATNQLYITNAGGIDATGDISTGGSLYAGNLLSVSNPNNTNATVLLRFLNDIATIRVGGTGAGASNNFSILGLGDSTILRANSSQLLFGASEHVVWHTGNDGAGSGLDADLLDGLQANQFLRTDIDTTYSTNIVFDGGVSFRHPNALVVVSPDGGHGTIKSNSVTGALKITLPVTWTNTMLTLEIEVFDFGSGKSCTYRVGGYNYSATSAWLNTFATVISGDYKANLKTVRFGHDGTNCVIYIGELNSVLSYPSVTVTKVIAQYGNFYRSIWESGWSVGFESTAFGTISSTRSATLLATNSKLLDGVALSQVARTDVAEVFDARVDFTGPIYANSEAYLNGGLRQGNDVILNGVDTWLRTTGDTGWFSTTYGGGIHMTDEDWVRVYNQKKLLVTSTSTDSIYTYGGVRSNTRFWTENPTGEGGLVGSYSVTGTSIDQMIWTIGSSWATHASHYGLGYHYGSELGTNDHQIVHKYGGTTYVRTSLRGRAWFAASVDTPLIKENGINIADKYLNVNSLNYNSPETWAAAWTAVDEFKEWVTSGDADTSGYATVTDSIATGFINSIIGNFNVVVADSGNIGYLTSRAIEVTGRQKLINNPAATGVIDTWVSSTSSFSTGTSTPLTDSNISTLLSVDGNPVTTVRVETSGNRAYSPAPIEVDHNAIYKVSVTLYVGGTTAGSGVRYLGITASDTKDRSAVTPLNVDRYDPFARTFSTTSNNFYAVGADPAFNTQTTYTFYVVGANRDVEDVPETDRNIAKLRSDTKYFFMRILNWANSGNETVMHIYNPSISEVNTGQIVAYNIAANAITTQKLSASAVTADKIASASINAGHIQAGAITTDKLAANAVTAAKIAAGTITASQIASGSITADRLVANSITASQIAAGTITATQLAANSVTADKLTARSVTATKLAVSGENAYPDYDCLDPDMIVPLTGTYELIATSYSAFGINRVRIPVAADLSNVRTDWRNIVEENEEYYLELKAFADGIVPTFSVYYQTGELTNTGAVINPTGAIPISAVSSTDPGNTISKSFTVAPGHRMFRLVIVVPEGAVGNNYASFGAIILRKKNKGTLIVDGTIDTNHLAAGSITTAKLDAGAVTATKIATGTITATQIDVSTLQIGDLSWDYGNFGSTGTDLEGSQFSTNFYVEATTSGTIYDYDAAMAIRAANAEDVALILEHTYSTAGINTPGQALRMLSSNALTFSAHSVGNTAGRISNNSDNNPTLYVYNLAASGVNSTAKGLHVEGRTVLLGGRIPKGLEVLNNGTVRTSGTLSADVGLFVGAGQEFGLYSSSGARQRFDSRDSGNEAILHMYGRTDTGGTVPARLAMYGGTVYSYLEGRDAGLRTRTAYGYVDIGPLNTTFCHFATDRSGFHLNKKLFVAGDVTFFYSDERLKTVHSVLDSAQALENVLNWKPVRYSGNHVAAQNGFDTSGVQIGLLAQDIESAYPELTPLAPFDTDGAGVSKSGEAYKTLKYERTTAVLVAALQEETKQRKILEERLARMEKLLQQVLGDK